MQQHVFWMPEWGYWQYGAAADLRGTLTWLSFGGKRFSLYAITRSSSAERRRPTADQPWARRPRHAPRDRLIFRSFWSCCTHLSSQPFPPCRRDPDTTARATTTTLPAVRILRPVAATTVSFVLLPLCPGQCSKSSFFRTKFFINLFELLLLLLLCMGEVHRWLLHSLLFRRLR